jgi:hypothetical protein
VSQKEDPKTSTGFFTQDGKPQGSNLRSPRKYANTPDKGSTGSETSNKAKPSASRTPLTSKKFTRR